MNLLFPEQRHVSLRGWPDPLVLISVRALLHPWHGRARQRGGHNCPKNRPLAAITYAPRKGAAQQLAAIVACRRSETRQADEKTLPD